MLTFQCQGVNQLEVDTEACLSNANASLLAGHNTAVMSKLKREEGACSPNGPGFSFILPLKLRHKVNIGASHENWSH